MSGNGKLALGIPRRWAPRSVASSPPRHRTAAVIAGRDVNVRLAGALSFRLFSELGIYPLDAMRLLARPSMWTAPDDASSQVKQGRWAGPSHAVVDSCLFVQSRAPLGPADESIGDCAGRTGP